jgi:hypothetical protein
MAKNVLAGHEKWLATPGKNDRVHRDSNVRTVHLPPFKSVSGWDIATFRDRWDLIDEVLKTSV